MPKAPKIGFPISITMMKPPENKTRRLRRRAVSHIPKANIMKLPPSRNGDDAHDAALSLAKALDEALWARSPHRRFIVRPMLAGEARDTAGNQTSPIIFDQQGSPVLANIVIVDRSKPDFRGGFYLPPGYAMPATDKDVLTFLRSIGFPI